MYALVLVNISQHTKFEMAGFIRSKDKMGPKI